MPRILTRIELLEHSLTRQAKALLFPPSRRCLRAHRGFPVGRLVGRFRLLRLDRFTLPSSGHVLHYSWRSRSWSARHKQDCRAKPQVASEVPENVTAARPSRDCLTDGIQSLCSIRPRTVLEGETAVGVSLSPPSVPRLKTKSTCPFFAAMGSGEGVSRPHRYPFCLHADCGDELTTTHRLYQYVDGQIPALNSGIDGYRKSSIRGLMALGAGSYQGGATRNRKLTANQAVVLRRKVSSHAV
jgi:hypothetical protein